MNKAYAWFRIVRPPIVFIGVFGSTVTALVFQGTPGAMDFAVPLHLWAFIWSMFCWGMLWGGIMVHNDYTDLKSDKYNKPHKPIPCGAITPRQAHLGGLAMMTLGWLLPIPILMLINVWFAVAAAFWGFTLWFVGIYYDYWGKGHGVAGHASVAWGVALIPLYGGALVSPYTGFALLLPIFLALFISEIGREILVCCHDYYGDIKQGWLTTPVVRGRMTAMRHVPLWYLGFIPFYAIPYFGWLGYPAYFSPIYFWGYTIFIIGLFGTWVAIYKTMLGTRDEKTIQWNFELYARTGTRLFIIFTQFVMLAEAVWGVGAG